MQKIVVHPAVARHLGHSIAAREQKIGKLFDIRGAGKAA